MANNDKAEFRQKMETVTSETSSLRIAVMVMVYLVAIGASVVALAAYGGVYERPSKDFRSATVKPAACNFSSGVGSAEIGGSGNSICTNP